MALNKFLRFKDDEGNTLAFYFSSEDDFLHVEQDGRCNAEWVFTEQQKESIIKFLQETPEFDKQKCQNCCERLAEQQHTCPYKVDVNNDGETLCNCCDDCRKECLRDI